MKAKLFFLFFLFFFVGILYAQKKDIVAKERFDSISKEFERKLNDYCKVVKKKPASFAIAFKNLKSTNLFFSEEEMKISKSKLREYYKASSMDYFTRQYQRIFSTIVLGSGDVVKNSSAFSYTQDKEKNTFSINGVFDPFKKKDLLLSLGLSIKNKDNNFVYYNNNSWASDISLNFGIIQRIGPATQFFDSDTCAAKIEKRKAAINKKKFEYGNLLKDGIKKLETEKENFLSKKADSLEDFDGTNYAELLEKKEVQIKKLKELLSDQKDAIDKITEKDLAEFDSINNILYGYKAHWLNYSGSITNGAIGLENDSIINDIYQKKYKSVIKFNIEASYNFQRLALNTLTFFQAYGKFNYGSYLDNPLYKGQKFKVREVVSTDNPANVYYNVVGDDNVLIQRYDELKTPVASFDVGSNGALMFLLKKSIGLNYRLNFNFPTFHNIVTDYTQNYSLLAGLIFRVSQEKAWTSTTFTMNCGYENVPYKSNAWDLFIVKASASIPFTAFDSKKK